MLPHLFSWANFMQLNKTFAYSVTVKTEIRQYLLVPKAVLFCPYEKPVLVVEEPKSPVAVLDVAVEDPNNPAVAPAPTGFEGPFLFAW